MKVLLDTSPLQSGHSLRGIGMYTRFLQSELLQIPEVTLLNESEKNEADIIHYPFFDLFFPTLPFFSGKAKRVVTIHDVIPLLFPEHYPVGIKGKTAHWRQKMALTTVDAVITDSHSSQQDINTYLGISAEKIHPIYLAGNPEITRQSKARQQSVRQQFGLPETFILYVGDINYNKNIPALIESLQYMKAAVHLVCVGKNFYPQPIAEWQAISEAMTSVRDRVHFVNDIPANANQTLASLYSAAAVYVQPSLYEGFGLPVLEALQVGTLVVCAKNSSLREIGGEVVEYTNTSAKEIAAAVSSALDLKEEKAQLRRKTGQQWVQQFSWYQTAKETVRVYEQLLNIS